MPANINPIFTRLGDIQWNTTPILALNATTDLTSGTSYLVFTADATNGGYVQKLRFRPLGTNIATVARVWITNATGPGVAANAVLFDEISLAISTASSTSATPIYELPINTALPAGYRIYITLGTAVASGYTCTAIGGKY
jgi:hypothetical protein